MKLTMKREALEKLNRLANEMPVGEAPSVTESRGFGTVMEQSGIWAMGSIPTAFSTAPTSRILPRFLVFN
jgi:hypothetical protein